MFAGAGLMVATLDPDPPDETFVLDPAFDDEVAHRVAVGYAAQLTELAADGPDHDQCSEVHRHADREGGRERRRAETCPTECVALRRRCHTLVMMFGAMTRLSLLWVLVAACSNSPASTTDAITSDAPTSGAADAPSGVLPPPLQAGDFTHALDKPYIRSFQTWIDDPGFNTKWQLMLGAQIDFLGGACSAFHADLASLARALPGGEALCHGDAKFDNFGWALVDGQTVFADNDFDDAGTCPAAADILHYLMATELLFADPQLDADALAAYVDTLTSDAHATAIDASTAPVWETVRTTGLAKTVSHSKLILGTEVEVATTAEVDAVTALAAADARFPTTVLDVARDVHVDGGSAGLRRFWLLVEDAQHPRTIIELKELTTPGTELGPHSTTYDGADRFDVLKPYWWDTAGLADYFTVYLLNGRFVARNRYIKLTPKPAQMTAAQITNMVKAEASLMAHKHRAAWSQIDPVALKTWLHDSAATLTERWRAAYSAAGGV